MVKARELFRLASALRAAASLAELRPAASLVGDASIGAAVETVVLDAATSTQ